MGPANPPPAATIRDANEADVPEIARLIEASVARRQILPRTPEELRGLTKNGFVGQQDGRIIGFVAIEVYSKKLAELICLAVDDDYQDQGLGRRLVLCCVERARQLGIYELMAVTAAEQFFMNCGFHYILPEQKRALFIHPGQ